MADKLPAQMDYAELVDARENAAHLMEQYQAEVSVYGQELLARLKADKLSGKIVGMHTVSKRTRLSFKIELAAAKDLGATKEVVDNTKLKALYTKGIDIPATTTEYVVVSEIKEAA